MVHHRKGILLFSVAKSFQTITEQLLDKYNYFSFVGIKSIKT